MAVSSQSAPVARLSFATMIQGLFAILFAALLMCLLYSSGFMSRTNPCAACDAGGYGWCQIVQDLRSLWSFALGAYLCSCWEGFYNPIDLLCSKEVSTDEVSPDEEYEQKCNFIAGLVL